MERERMGREGEEGREKKRRERRLVTWNVNQGMMRWGGRVQYWRDNLKITVPILQKEKDQCT